MKTTPPYVSAMKPKNTHYDRYQQRIKYWQKIERKTAYWRLVRLDEMTRNGRTVEQIYTVSDQTKVTKIKRKRKNNEKWEKHPELWEQYQKQHHPDVSRRLALERHWNWINIFKSCNNPKHADYMTISEKMKKSKQI